MFANLFNDLAVPYVTWFVDDPRTILLDRDLYGTPCATALTWDTAYEDYLRLRGFGRVETMPLAVDDTVFNGAPAESTLHAPAFVGSSMVGHAADEWAWISQYPDLTAVVCEALDAGRLTRDGFATVADAVGTGRDQWL